jgi:autotransporter-associated beta strand protein
MLAAAPVAAAVSSQAVFAATDTWTGGGTDTNWNTSGNWTGGNPTPAAGDTLVFGVTTHLASNNDATGLSLGGLQFSTGASAYTLTGNNIALTGGLIDNAATSVETINFSITGTAASSLQLSTESPTNGGLGGESLTFGASQTFGSLLMQANSATTDTVTIGSGNTLNILGTATVGIASPAATSAATTATLKLTGGGNYNQTSGNMSVVAAASANNLGTQTATLDASGLSNFTYNVPTGTLAIGFNAKASGTLKLANNGGATSTNTITAATISVGDSNGKNNGGTSTLSLGSGTNTINATNLNLGAGKATATVNFQGSGGSLTLGPLSGSSSPLTITIARATSSSNSNSTSGSQLQLAGHQAGVTAGTVTVGQQNGATANSSIGFVTFDTGTFTTDTLQLAVDTSGSNPDGPKGTFTMGGASANNTATGVLTVNTNFYLANLLSTSTGTRTATGTFIQNGGTTNVGGDIKVNVASASVTGTASTSLTLAGGTLNMNGHQIGGTGTQLSPFINTVTLPAAGQIATLRALGGGGINNAGLTMNGAGTLIMAGSNTYSGATTISSGTLVASGALPSGGNVNVNSGGTLSGTGDGTTSGVLGNLILASGGSVRPGVTSADGQIGTLTAGSLTVNGGDMRFDLNGGSNDLLSISGAASYTAASTITISPSSTPGAGPYTLVSDPTNAISFTNQPTLTQTVIGRTTYGLDFSDPHAIKLTVSGNPANLTWRGDSGAAAWDVNTTQNWNNISQSINPDVYFDADNVTFNDTGTSKTVNLNALTVNPGSVTFSNTSGGGAYTVTGTGAIGGTTGVSLSGGGTVFMNTVNSYSGNTTISNGSTLSTANLAATGTNSGIGASGNLVLDGGTLQWTGSTSTSTNRPIVLTTNGGTIASVPAVAQTLTVAGTVTFSGSGARTLTLSGTDTTLAANVLSSIVGDGVGGATSLVKNGNNNWAINVAETYSGGATINAGRLRATNNAAYGTGTVTVNSGGQAYLNTGSTFLNNFSIAGNGVQESGIPIFAGALRLGTSNVVASGTITLSADARISGRGATSNSTISGKITGAHNLELGNGGTVGVITLSNVANDWSGSTTISLGTVKAGASSTGSTGVIPHGSVAGDVTINGIAQDANNVGNSTLDLNGFNLTVNGLNSSVSNLAQVVVTNSSANAGTLTMGDNNATATFAGTIQAGTGTLNIAKIGGGTQTLSGVNSYTGSTSVNAGTLAILSAGSIAASSTVNVSSGATFDVSDFTAGGGFTVPSTQTLLTNGSVNGSINLNGTVAGTSTGNITGTLTTAGGSHINAGATAADGQIGTLNAASVTVNGGDFRIDTTTGNVSDLINVIGAMTFNNPATVTVVPPGQSGTYTIMQAGSFSGADANLSLSQTTFNRNTYSLDFTHETDATPKILLNVTATTAALSWNNTGLTGDGVTWDVLGNKNWTSTASVGDPNQFYQNDSVTFNDTNNSNYNVTVSTTVNPTSVLVDNSSGDYVFGGGGAISGATSLTKQGSRAITINNANSYTGGTIMNAGTLNLAAAGAVGNGPLTVNGGTVNLSVSGALTTGAVVLNSGNLNIGNAGALGTGAVTLAGGTVDNTSGADMTLSTSNTYSITGSFAYAGTANKLTLGTGAVTINASNPTITVTNNTLAIPAVIGNGTGNGFTKTGSGTLVLGAANTFTGALNINGGLVQLGNATGLGTTAGATNINAGGTLDFNNQIPNNTEQFNIAGNGSSGQGALYNSVGTSGSAYARNVTLTGNAAIGCAASVRWDLRGGTPALDLNGFNLTRLGAGQISIVAGNIKNSGTGPNTIEVTGGLFSIETSTNTVGTNGSIIYDSGIAAQFFANTGSVTWPMTFNGNNLIGNASTSTLATIASNMTIVTGNVTLVPLNGGVAVPAQNVPFTLTGNIGENSGAGATVTKAGVNTVTLSGTNTWTGGTLLQAGTLKAGSSGAIPSTGTVTMGDLANDSAVLDLNGNTITVGGLASLGTGTLQIGSSSTAAASTLNYAGGGTPSTFGGVIQDTIGAGNQKTALTVSSGSLNLTAPNTYTGNTTVNNGATLAVAATGSLASTTNLVANGNAHFSNAAQTVNTLNGSGGVSLDNGVALTISNGGTFSGVISDDPGSVTIAGGTMTLSGANTYTGNTTVNTGATLNVTGSLAATDNVITNTNSAVNFGAPLSTVSSTQQLASLTVAPGSTSSITASMHASTPKTLQVGTLTFGDPGSPSTSTLDITNNILIANGADTDAEALIASHKVVSTTAGLALGYKQLTTSPDTSEIRATLLGDSDLDGQVNVADLANLAGNFGKTIGQVWLNGDFDYNGNVNVADLADLAGNFGKDLTSAGFSSSASAAAPAAVSVAAAVTSGAAVPEPASLGLVGIGAIALLSRRRRRNA